MELLDAALAFALTLAALATVVTVIMEIVLRSVLMRKRNLIHMMRLLNDELPRGPLDLDEQERWAFFRTVIENPAEGLSARIPATLPDGKTAKQAIEEIGWLGLRSGVYDKVSMEHVLRRLAEITKIAAMAKDAAQMLKTELYRFAGKFEEFGSSVSASFKRRSQIWSIIFGVLLAIVVNVDGMRIFEAYLAKPDLARTVIAREDQFLSAYEQAERRKQAIFKQQEVVRDARSTLDKVREEHGDSSPQSQSAAAELALAQTRLADLTEPEEIRRLALDAQQQVKEIVALGVPIGNEYFPHCRLFRDVQLLTTCAGPLWPDGAEWSGRFRFIGHVLVWLVPVVITGLLIGLGAPFWFDVAKRLAQVREMFNGTGSDSTRLAARDADGDPGKRAAIVDRVVADAAGETFTSKAGGSP